MGNETSLLKKCTLSNKPRHVSSEWSLFDATSANQLFSVFVFVENEYFNDITRWKHMRHPNLVKCYEAGIYKGKKCILTEPVDSIRSVLDKQHEYLKLCGLNNIGDALSFLHEVCGISVNNLSIDSIFVARNDCNEMWKLGSLYWYSSIDTESEEFFKQLIGFHTSHNSLETLPPEDREMSTHKLIRSSKHIHRRDSYAYVNLIGKLLYDSQNPLKLSEMILASECEVSNFRSTIKLLIDNLNILPSDQRPVISELLNNQLFLNCVFVRMRQFFNNFSTYNEYEKNKFFETFIERLRILPDQLLIINIFKMIVTSRLIMSNDFIYNEVMPFFLIPSMNSTEEQDNCLNEDNIKRCYVLTNGKTISLKPIIKTSIYRDHVIPYISNLFCVHDFKIRMLLLLYLPHYGPLISKNVLRKDILPQILLGIKDNNNDLVALTFRALAVLIDTFGVVAVLGGSKRPKYFTTGISRDSRLPSEASNNENHLDDNISTVSAKSSSTLSTSSFNLSYKIPAHMISERSSPDGDEINSNEQITDGIIKTNGRTRYIPSNNLNLVDDDNDEWPEWNESNNISKQVNGLDISNNEQNPLVENIEFVSDKQTPILKVADKKSSISKSKDTLQTFDIKEIDFKEISDNNEIENLFKDLTPILNFNQKKNVETVRKQRNSAIVSKTNGHANTLKHKTNRHNEIKKCESPDLPVTVDLSLFEPKNDDINLDDCEDGGWNDSLELGDVSEVENGLSNENIGNVHKTDAYTTVNSATKNDPLVIYLSEQSQANTGDKSTQNDSEHQKVIPVCITGDLCTNTNSAEEINTV